MRGTHIIYAHPTTLRILTEREQRYSSTCDSLWWRLRAAWLVFSGQADALMWNGEHTYGYESRRAIDAARAS